MTQRLGELPSDKPLKVDYGAGAPSHEAALGTLYVDTTGPTLYVNVDGGVTWSTVGGGGGGGSPESDLLAWLAGGNP